MNISEEAFLIYFPRLNLPALSDLAMKWAREYADANIIRILLCSYRSPYEVDLRREKNRRQNDSNDKKVPSRMPSYAVVFEVGDTPYNKGMDIIGIPNRETRRSFEELVNNEWTYWQRRNVSWKKNHTSNELFGLYLCDALEFEFVGTVKPYRVFWEGYSVSIKIVSEAFKPMDDEAAITVLLSNDEKPQFSYKDLDQYTDIRKAQMRLCSDLQPEPGDTPADLYKYRFIAESDSQKIYKGAVIDGFRSEWDLSMVVQGESISASVEKDIQVILYSKEIPDGPFIDTEKVVKKHNFNNIVHEIHTDDNTEWNDIKITFLSDEEILIQYGDESDHRKFNFAGFEDKRNGKPINSWVVLCEAGKKGREISFSFNNRRQVEKIAQTLNKKLSNLFPNIKNLPVQLNKDKNAYQFAFQIDSNI